MEFFDFIFILKWWLVIFVIGFIFLPSATRIFKNFFDKGYIFSKIIGTVIISYVAFILGVTYIAPFTGLTLAFILTLLLIFNLSLVFKIDNGYLRIKSAFLIILKEKWVIFVFEEILFIIALFFWSYVRSYAPDIHGLEKYMDFGFVNSILRSEYFPPKDMWFTPFSINYYYFGHLATAVLTKLSGIPSNITFNLMLATIFAFTFTASFSIGANLIYFLMRGATRLDGLPTARSEKSERALAGGKFGAGPRAIIAGFLTAFLISFAGNLQTIYAFFKPYQNDNPVPFWQLSFSPFTFPNSYWYPNATRFIYHTIHEFPIYSFVVSDLHGHVLDIPLVLFAIALLFSIFMNTFSNNRLDKKSKIKNQNYNSKFKNFNYHNFAICDLRFEILLAFLLAIMYMTNAWDGIIYFLLIALVFLFFVFQKKIPISKWFLNLIFIGIFFILFSFPFNHYFKPFVSGIGIICPPQFLIDRGKIGPFLFEPNTCQRSPIWQLLILYGFFYFWVISFLIFVFKKLNAIRYTLAASDIFVLLLIILSTILIIIPEFIYIKDIYTTYYRANTMFKLVYQSFIMLSISSGYIIIRLILNIKYKILNIFNFYFVFFIFSILFFILVAIYPYFAINSYYNNFKINYGLDGTAYLKNLYPTDYEAILWINKNIKGQPVILEAQGDSYTDFARVSANTGLPTVLGWTVHEWLWRGTYDVPAPRIPEVQILYETTDINITKELIGKYKISYIFIGDLEYQKYSNLAEQKFQKLGKIIYQNGRTKIYKITSPLL